MNEKKVINDKKTINSKNTTSAKKTAGTKNTTSAKKTVSSKKTTNDIKKMDYKELMKYTNSIAKPRINKKVILLAIIVIITITISVATIFIIENNKEDPKVLFYGHGSTIYFNSYKNTPFTIDELGIQSDENCFVIQDYLADERGQEYNISNSKGTKVGTIKLLKKDEIYTNKEIKIDLTQYEKDNIIVEADVNRLYIEGDPTLRYNLHINILTRDEALDIYLKNANIVTVKRVPVICNFSLVDINLIVEGKCSLTAGDNDFSQEEYEQMLNEEIEYGIKLGFYAAPVIYYKAIEGGLKLRKDLIYSIVETAKSGEVDTTFIDNYYNTYEEINNLTLTWGKKFFYSIQGQHGIKGFDGETTITSLGNVCVYGTGNLTIIGGAGGNGGDAISGGVDGARGGTGGSSGYAINALGFINTLNAGKCKVFSGFPGEGGEGKKGFGQVPAKNGADGEMREALNCIEVYNK